MERQGGQAKLYYKPLNQSLTHLADWSTIKELSTYPRNAIEVTIQYKKYPVMPGKNVGDLSMLV
jgi:hypothetical protein